MKPNLPLVRLPIAAVVWITLALTAGAQPSDSPAVRCDEINGTLLSKKGDGWQPVKVGDEVPVGTNLLALFHAKLDSANRAVKATMVGDVGMHGKLPVLDAALQLDTAPGGVDLALTLQRGVVLLENHKSSGPAKIQLTLRGQPLLITLREPGAKLGVEIYSRHAPGRASMKTDDPATFVMMLAFKGHILLSHKQESIQLHAPPGPALLRWDSISKHPEVEHLNELPALVQKPLQMKLIFAKMGQAAKVLNSADAEQRQAALKKLIQEDVKIDRLVGVTAAGALDDLGVLVPCIGDPKHADVREQAIMVLRHWVGREPGQLAKLHKYLMKERKVSAGQAGSMVHLLLGFETRDADTFDVLINFLDNPHLGARTLAYWHLVRLVPDGKSFGYDPAASEEQRRAAVQRWRDFIPPGELPPAPKK